MSAITASMADLGVTNQWNLWNAQTPNVCLAINTITNDILVTTNIKGTISDPQPIEPDVLLESPFNSEWQLNEILFRSVDYISDPNNRCIFTDPTAIGYTYYTMPIQRIAYDGGSYQGLTGSLPNGNIDHMTNCCFKDGNNGIATESNYYNDSTDFPEILQNQQDTCPTVYRSLGNNACSTIIARPGNSFCFPLNDNNSPNLELFTNRWTKSIYPPNSNNSSTNCYYWYQRTVSANEFASEINYYLNPETQDPQLDYNDVYLPDPQPVSNQFISNKTFAITTAQQMLRYITSTNSNSSQSNAVNIFALPDSPNFDNSSNVLYQLCKDYPIACNDMLTNLCSDQNTYSIVENPGSLRWCGCHLPAEAYNKYTQVYNIPIACSPSCNREGVIPYTPPGDQETVPVPCANNNICIIDSLNIQYSQSGGDINISQICGGCANENSSCKCVIEDDRFILDSQNPLSQQNINLNQFCGGGLFFYESKDVNGNVIYVPTSDPVQQQENEIKQTNRTLLLFVIVGFLIFLAILGIYF